MLDLAVLGLLKDQPLHGYELKKRLGDTLGFLWGVSYGSLYPSLRRLERDGAIESVIPEAPSMLATGSLGGELASARRRMGERLGPGSRRTRKAYRITPRGDELFNELLVADDPRVDDDKAFALKLAFLGRAPHATRVGLLERRRAVLAARLDRSRSRSTRAATTTSGIDRYTRSLVEHRTNATQRDLEWVTDLIAAESPDREGPAAARTEGASA
ncbi:MAG: PadR family transcriptional regulator [Actinobacteria bacterium]|nr:MAG: PadR family transcriptional regulator [Actinomycetota bacterium]